MAQKTVKGDSREEIPDQIKVNAVQAERLAAIARLKDPKELVGVTYADVAERLKWHIEPHLFLFRKICGRVVKKDPVTGAEYPVPNATVTVQDTDCGLVAYFPPSSKYGWYFPFHCRRETLATVKTDECGNFCVWIPRWDIDWILRWRKERFCFPTIFERPSILDILRDIPVLVDERMPPKPIPGPDPAPDVDYSTMLDGLSRLSSTDLTNAVGPVLAERLRGLHQARAFGASTSAASLLDEPAFPGVLPPPLPEEFKQVDGDTDEKRASAHTMDHVRGTIAERLGLDVKRLAELDLRYPIGPFKRCITYYVPEWSFVLDVPDITFRVTQDVDGDGTEEVIYSEGFFDVRWNAGAIPPVKLIASGLARESKVCEAPPVVCGNVSDIQFAGMMPLKLPYHSNTSGYGRRPNRPRPVPPGTPVSPATAPFCGNVNLFGCLVVPAGATTYRLVYKYSSNGGATFSSETPFTDGVWNWHPLGGPPVPASAGPGGWYALPPSNLIGPEVNFLYPFNTGAHPDGLYEIRLQLGTGGSSVLSSSAAKRLRIDNSLPVYTPSIRWRLQGETDLDWRPLTYPCPLVKRRTTPVDVEFDVKWEVSATHYRNAAIGAGDCGSGSFNAPVIQPGSTASGASGTDDWHQGPSDNSVVFHARYTLPALAAQGTYNFGLHASTRAFSPAGADANYQALDWLYDSPNGGLYVTPSFFFSVVNVN
jgi:hypothetical protein